MSGQTLAERVADAVTGALEGEVSLSYEAIVAKLPTYLIEAKPKKKTVIDAIRAGGWSSYRNAAGDTIWRAPAELSDPMMGGEGHNLAGDQLRLYFERLDRLEDERKGINDDIKDVFAEAKSVGFDVKTMRAVFRLWRTEKHVRDESDALIEAYRAALGLN